MAGFEHLKKFFQSENFRYEEEEGILSFKIQGVNYFAFTNDSPFLQIVIVCNISNKDKTKILEICNELNSDKFVTKFILRGERVWCSYEFNPSDIPLLTNLWLFLVFSTRHQMSSLKK